MGLVGNITGPTGATVEFEFDGSGDVQPTASEGTMLSNYEIAPADVIVSDGCLEGDLNGDLQPVA